MSKYILPRKRPKITKGSTLKINTGCGSMYVTLRDDDLVLCEIFINVSKAGGCIKSQREAIGRLVSLVLRLGGDPQSVINELREIGCPLPAGDDNDTKVLSCADGVAQIMSEYTETREQYGKGNDTGKRKDKKAGV